VSRAYHTLSFSRSSYRLDVAHSAVAPSLQRSLAFNPVRWETEPWRSTSLMLQILEQYHIGNMLSTCLFNTSCPSRELGWKSGTELDTARVWPDYTLPILCMSGHIFEDCSVSVRFSLEAQLVTLLRYIVSQLAMPVFPIERGWDHCNFKFIRERHKLMSIDSHELLVIHSSSMAVMVPSQTLFMSS
jgi:hypothetical protein